VEGGSQTPDIEKKTGRGGATRKGRCCTRGTSYFPKKRKKKKKKPSHPSRKAQRKHYSQKKKGTEQSSAGRVGG